MPLLRGTKDISVAVSTSSASGDGTVVASGSLTDLSTEADSCNVPVDNFLLGSPVQARYVKINLISYYGSFGGGIQYFTVFIHC